MEAYEFDHAEHFDVRFHVELWHSSYGVSMLS